MSMPSEYAREILSEYEGVTLFSDGASVDIFVESEHLTKLLDFLERINDDQD
jgi:hypothetical protein